MPKKSKKPSKALKDEVKKLIKVAEEEVAAEEATVGQCLRCGGKKHEPNVECDAMQNG